jgi:hypothetical protein
MALTDIETVRLLIGDTPTSPFYMLFDDESIQAFLTMNGGNVRQASRMAAIAASMQLAGWTTRETTGDLEVWNVLSTAYLKALDNFISDTSSSSLPNGLRPYASGISWADVNANNANPDNIRPPLTKISVCGDKGSCSSSSESPFGTC